MTADADAGVVFQPPRGVKPKPPRFGGKHFFKARAEGAPTTTRQAEVLNTAIIGTPGDNRGVVIGTDQLSGAMVAHDPFSGYENHRITSPNACLIGMLGSTKSSCIKTVYVARPLTLRRRRAVVMDKKPRDGEGEYAELTRHFGAEPYRFDPDDPRGSTCMNVLDPVILAGGGPAVQRQLLSAVAELAGDGPLDEWHNKVLTVAYRALMRKFEGGRTPIIPDLIQQIPGVVNAPEFAGSYAPGGVVRQGRLRRATLDRIEQSASSLQFRLERLLADDLAGMFGGETSKHVTLHSKLTTFDISALPEDGPATSMVMVIANAWLMGMLTHDRGYRTSFIAEEGWHLLAGPGGKVIRSKSKLSRGLGLSIVAAIHHISDIPKDSDAIAMIKEAQTIHLFRQEHDTDIQDCVKYFGLEASNADTLGTLPQGEHLLKIGSDKEIRVKHVRTEREKLFTETDKAMLLEPAKVTV
jgi:hypothetical protein